VSKEIIIRSNSTAVDFALLKDGKLIELHKQNDGKLILLYLKTVN